MKYLLGRPHGPRPCPHSSRALTCVSRASRQPGCCDSRPCSRRGDAGGRATNANMSAPAPQTCATLACNNTGASRGSISDCPTRSGSPVGSILTRFDVACLTRGRVGALRGRHTTTTY
eukprot:5959196-Prymnesium_polylepis.1